MINSLPCYFLMPLYFSLAIFLIFFNVPDGFLLSLLSLFLIVTPIVLVASYLTLPRLNLAARYADIIRRQRHRVVIYTFCCLIVIFGPLDILVNGFKILDPASYAELPGVGRYVRHISSLCWLLVPVAFIFVRSKLIKVFLISYAVIFPILIVDRNRLFMSFFSVLLCLFIVFDGLHAGRKKRLWRKLIGLVVFLGISVFLMIGYYRSGSAFLVDSTGSQLVEGGYPLSDVFFLMPELVQQLILYVTTPIFNFATIVHDDFTNPEFLLRQLSPFARDDFDLYPYAPVMVPRFNVGTEFYPFLLYGGLEFVFFAVTFMVLTFALSVRLLDRYPNIFTFFIFLKVAYSAVFVGFAPQFFILLNFMFIILMLVLWSTSSLLITVSKVRVLI